MRGLGLALFAALVVAIGIVYALLPAAETTVGIFNAVPEAMQNAGEARRLKEAQQPQQ
jgi:ABC-type arginine transport system permease subunit